MLTRKKVKTLISLYKIIEDFYGKDNFYVATYVYIRYGIKTFNKEIKSRQLKKINEELKQYKTLFDRDLSYRIDRILNEE